tara:strand:- start:136 stop:807 length:672 start_codon:yes stop_codon:yes gene_type:complete
MKKLFNKFKKQSGLTLLEALISSSIVGIGFIAIFSMVNFSVQSIDTSGERTKANYLVAMIAEDIIGHKDSVYGINTDDEGVAVDASGNIVKKDGSEVEGGLKKFSDHLKDEKFQVEKCKSKPADGNEPDPESVYLDIENSHGGAKNKHNKWQTIFGDDRYLKCRGDKDIKNVKIFEICKWDHCDYKNTNITDEALYIGRVQVNLNNGKKRRFLYFQADYKIKD